MDFLSTIVENVNRDSYICIEEIEEKMQQHWTIDQFIEIGTAFMMEETGDAGLMQKVNAILSFEVAGRKDLTEQVWVNLDIRWHKSANCDFLDFMRPELKEYMRSAGYDAQIYNIS